MMIDRITLEYHVAGYTGYTFDEAARLYKTRYEQYDDFHRNVINHPGLRTFGENMREFWEDIIPLTIQEVMAIQNVEKRRSAFSCIGVERLFKEMQPELIKAETITKQNHRWDMNNREYIETLEDVYELYRIPKEKLYAKQNLFWDSRDAYAVRCWCTSTKREYFIYVPQDIGEKGDPIEAIAWTCRLNVRNPRRLYRQGDVFIAETNPEEPLCIPYHLNRMQYLSLLYSET